jgi:hypothetical protein
VELRAASIICFSMTYDSYGSLYNMKRFGNLDISQ